jgi:hypothetical protein
MLGLAMAFTLARAEVPPGPPTFGDPSNITNVFQPFQPGGMKVYRGRDHGKSVAALDLYLTETRTFLWNATLVECRILREVAFEGGKLVEISDNYFAQGDDGAVYYFGEVVDNYENGVIDNHEGSWLVGGPTLPSDPVETGVETDPTVFMPAHPEKHDVFKPEDELPIVDETAEVISVGKRVRVPAGRYRGAIIVKETTQLSSDRGRKWYVPGVGVVKALARRESLVLTASTLVPPE